MKRSNILLLVLACFAVLCLGQRRARVARRQIIQLTEPNLSGKVMFEEALAKQQSVRQFSSESIKRTDIGQLAWAGQGVIDPQSGLRTAPSPGSIYPIELFFATEEGVFAYSASEHSLEQTSDMDIRSALATVTSMQESVAGAGCDIIVAGFARKLTPQFGNKARTHMLLEAGRVAQNIQLQAVCLDLGSATVSDFDARGVTKICSLPRTLEPVYIICVGYPAAEGTADSAEGRIGAGGKKAVLIVASENFRDEELFETRRVLDAAQVDTFVASTRTGIIRGVLGNAVEARILVNQLRVDDYDAIVFIGGPGAVEYAGNPVAVKIAREAVRKGKVLGAIGVAPTILANAGVLTGIRATSFLSERERLVQAGALYTGNDVERERERRIITATGPLVAIPFGKAIEAALAGRWWPDTPL